MSPKELQKLNEGRLLAFSSPALIPLLEKKKDDALNALVADFRAGREEVLSRVAELSVLHELVNEIKRKNKQTEKLEEKQHGI